MIALIIPILIQIESGGDNKAIGDNGYARGCLQIHRQYWEDGRRFLNVDWDYKTNSFDREKSIAIASAYLYHYGRVFEKRTGHKANVKILAMIHNGGPFAWRQNHKYHGQALKYANKVKRILENEKDTIVPKK